MATWLVRLAGDKSGLQALMRLFSTPDMTVKEEKGDYYLESVDFNSLTDAEQVLARGRGVVSSANGIARFLLGDFQGAEVNGVARVHANGRVDQFIFPNPIRIEWKIGIPTVTGGAPSPSPVQKWMSIASQDEKVTVALRLYGSPDLDWFDLYSVYETIKDDVGRERIVANGRATSDSEINRFTQTANAMHRHPPGKYDPPKNPMSLQQGRSFIGAILESWIRSKE